MSAHGPGELLVNEADGKGSAAGDVLPVSSVLAMCDRTLGEIGRRRHLFAWLRSPDRDGEGWLPVDGYYPRNRLVVICRETSQPADRVYQELVPAHGLRLLEVKPAELGSDPGAAGQTLERMLARLGLPKPPAAAPEPAPPPRARVVVQALSSLWQAPEAPVPRRPPASVPRRPPASVAVPRSRRSDRVPSWTLSESRSDAARRAAMHVRAVPQAPVEERREIAVPTQSLVLGVVLAAIVAAEVYLAVGVAALGSGRVLLGVAIALDACVRALGTLAAGRTPQPEWAWTCVLGGSPLVAVFALLRPSGPETTEPAPLAGVLAIIALLLIAIAALTGG